MAAAQTSTTPLTFSGMTAVGGRSAPVTVTLTAQSNGTLTSLAALTGGFPNLDFAVTPLTCAINMPLTTGESCTVSVVFSPQYPGVRQGAVVATASGQLLASSPLSGVGQGSLPVLVPGTINTVAGDGDWIYQRDGIPAIDAPIFLPSGLAVDAAGDLFLCDSSNNRVRRVDAATGNISTVAGNGSPGGAGDGGQATSAELSNPSGIAIDGAGDLFIADTGNNVVRRVDAISGVITTFAGQMGTMGYSGDGGAATSALLVSPRGLALMPGGDLLITDSGNNAIRLVNITSNQINTIAGTGVAGYNGDAIAATSAQLNDPYGVAVRSDGAIAIADLENQRVRLVNTSGVISTALGTGQRDAGTPTQEQLDGPADVAFDPAGDLFVADAGNNRVRVVLAAGGAIETIVGTSSEQFTGDGGPANQASIYGPYALVFDEHGNIWFSDTFHNRVREITGSLLDLTYATIKVGNVSPPMVEALSNDGNANLVLGTPVLNQAALDPATTTCNQTAMASSAFCDMGVEFAPTTVGANITGSVSWPSNAPNVTPMDALNGQVLSVNVTSVSLSSSANPGALGHAITFTATVSSANSSRTGTVTFTEGGTTWCPAVTLNSSGTAACAIASLSLGSHTITASYSGDTNDAASTSPGFTEVIKQQPALVLGVSPDPAVVGHPVTLSLTAVDSSGTPTGTVVFYDGDTSIGSGGLDGSGTAGMTTSVLSVGTHTLSAQYGGDSANTSGASNTVSEPINQATTTTALALSAAVSTVGLPLTFTATVTNNSGPALSGSVTFYDGSTALFTQPLSGSGTSSLSLSTLAPGSHNITASYSGNTNNAASTSAAMTETINQIATVTTLSSGASVLNAGATLQLTATTTLAAGATADGAITGTVTFRDSSTVLGAVSLNVGGQALLTLPGLSVGSHTLTASFAGNTNYAASNASTVAVTVQQTATQTALSSTSTTTLAGNPVTFSAAVTSSTGTPTGVVSFHDGATLLATVGLSGAGTATFSSSTLARGAHAISAAYGGDANYLASASATLQQTIQLAAPTVTLSGPATTVEAGLSAGFTAALNTPGVTPTGALSLVDGSSVIATDTVSGDGSFAFSTTALAVGTHSLTASYGGDANNSAAASAAVTVVVRQASSTTSLAVSVSPVIQGNPLSLTAMVTSDSPGLGGQVSFLDGATVIGSSPLGATGGTSLSLATLSPGTHTLTAVYGGDTNHAGSTSAAITEVVLATPSATFTSNNNPAASGQNVTLTVLLSGGTKVVPTGTAVLLDNGAPLASVPLNNSGGGSFTTSALTVGTHAITLSYAGDANFAATTAQLTQTVIDAKTATTLSGPSNPATFGQAVSLTATVTSNGGAATGTVTFTDGGKTMGNAPLNAAGVATFTLSTLSPGPHTIVAQYAGDGKAAPSSSPPLSLSVKQTTALVMSADSNPALTLNPINVTVTATGSGAAPITGNISFTEGGATLGIVALDSTGHATLTVPPLTPNVYQVVASYAGDSENFASTASPWIETVQLRPTTTTVTGSAADPANPQQITLIAVVAGQGPVPPGGTVTFSTGGTALGQAPVNAAGVAIITAAFTEPSEPITVSYPGDSNYAGSQSTSPIAVGSVTTAPQFVLAVSTASIKVETRDHATVQVNIASVTGFTDTIALGCLGLPHAGTCTFTPSQVVLSANGTASATLVVDTGNPLGSGSGTASLPAFGRGTFLCWLPIGLLAGFLGRKRGGMFVLFLLAAGMMALAGGVSGCSGLSTSATQPGTYTIKVVGTGQGTGASETQTVTLVVTE
jgi:sugar lactone lactonase YvrE